MLPLLTRSPGHVCTQREPVLLSYYRLQLWKVLNAPPAVAAQSVLCSSSDLGRSNPVGVEHREETRAERYLQQNVVTGLALAQLHKAQGPRAFSGHKRKAAQLYSLLSISPDFKFSKKI